MGYTFTIGNAVPEFSKDDGELLARWDVEGATHPDAPTFPNDQMTGNSNSRSPSYTAWHDFCKTAGIFGLFYDERGHLHAGHPGCVMLTNDDLEVVRLALNEWKKKATLPPGFDGFPRFNHEARRWETPDEGKYDPILGRLIWLEWWMDWALKNCETPAIQNT